MRIATGVHELNRRANFCSILRSFPNQSFTVPDLDLLEFSVSGFARSEEPVWIWDEIVMAVPNSNTAQPRSETLVEIIRVQTEIARLGLDLGSVMDVVAARVQALTRATGAVIELVENDDMVYRAASGLAERQLGLRLKRDGSLSGLCVKTGEILRCDDSEADARVDREACRRVGVRSMLVAPLIHQDTNIGALKVASGEVAAFGDEDIKVLELMSGLIAAAMYHAARHDPDELYHRATHDPLTGLANRALFYDRLRQCLALSARRSSHVGILNLDMDGLKAINDQFGHRAGDAAIRETADRIARISRRSDTVARLGGDEFGVVMSEVQDRENVIRHKARIAEEIGQPFRFENNVLPLRASIGFAVSPDDGTEINRLVDQADQSMYDMKRARRAG